MQFAEKKNSQDKSDVGSGNPVLGTKPCPFLKLKLCRMFNGIHLITNLLYSIYSTLRHGTQTGEKLQCDGGELIDEWREKT